MLTLSLRAGLELTDAELGELGDAILLNTSLRSLQLQRHSGLSKLGVDKLTAGLRGSEARGRPHAIECQWRLEGGGKEGLHWWRGVGDQMEMARKGLGTWVN